MKNRWIALIVLSVLLAAAVGIPVAGRLLANQGIEVHASMAENGGWMPGNLTAVVGQPLHLRLTSDDVTHSFAIGQMDLPVVEIKPGEWSEVTLTFDHPGKYTYYCTRWCGVNHWRMRGTINVSALVGNQVIQPTAEAQPLYVILGQNIDQPHPASVIPAATPSARRAEALEANLPAEYQSLDYDRAHSPYQLWQTLRRDQTLKGFSDQDLWDLVASILAAHIAPDMLAEGKQLYAQNCAACHGQAGDGGGVMVDALANEISPGVAMGAGKNTGKPANFTDLTAMLGASPAVLQGKILRGGMGTGMPYWGPIFTEEQTWALVAAIRSFQFDLESKP
jgi:mono/diheme cytochrome c family protein/plastocyanin